MMQLQRQVYTYYKKKLYKGRSTVARAADFIFLRLFFFMAVYVISIYLTRMIWVSVLLAVLLTAALTFGLHIYKRYRLKKFMDTELASLKKECLLEKIVMMHSNDYRTLTKSILSNLGYEDIAVAKEGYQARKEGQRCFARAFFLHPSEKVGVNEVLGTYKSAKDKNCQQVILLTPSEFNKEAQIFAKRQENITLIESKEFLDLAIKSGFTVNDEEAGEAAMQAIRTNAVTPDDIREATLGKGKAKAYMLCGIFALVWSYISGFQFFYPIISLVCFGLAFVIHRREQASEKKA